MLRAALAVAVVTATGCLVPLGIPASRVEGGYAAQGGANLRVGTHVVGYRRDPSARWDLGAGYSLTTVAAAAADPMTTAATTHASGVYLEGSYLHRIDDHARVSIGPGMNLMFRDSAEDMVPVAYFRVGVELYAPVMANVSSSDKCGVAAGTWFGQAALGVYADIEKPFDGSGVAGVVGLSGRLPAFGGAAIVIPYCK